MKIQIPVFHMNDFLKVVNDCDGEVNLLYPDGQKENICREYQLQERLLKRFRDQHNYMKVFLELQKPRDYYAIVMYSILEG